MSCLRRVALAALLVAMVSSVAAGETITTLFSDGFEAEAPDVLNSLLTQWDILAGSIDVLASSNVCGNAGDASNCLDLDGTDPAGGTIQTKAAFALGAGLYRLSFDLAGSQRSFRGSTDTVTVALGSYILEDFTLDFDDPFGTINRDFTVLAPDSVRVYFEHHGADQVGLLLDNVRLAQVIPDVPPPNPQPIAEPGTFFLLVAGLALLGWRGRKRAKRIDVS